MTGPQESFPREEFGALVKSEIAKWEQVKKATGLVID